MGLNEGYRVDGEERDGVRPPIDLPPPLVTEGCGAGGAEIPVG